MKRSIFYLFSFIFVFGLITLYCVKSFGQEFQVLKEKQIGTSKLKDKRLDTADESTFIKDKEEKARKRGGAARWKKTKDSEEIKPYVEVQEEYNDNIFRTKSDTEEDMITRISPGVKFGTRSPGTSGNFKLYLDIGNEFVLYAKNSKFDDSLPYLDFSLSDDIITLSYLSSIVQMTSSEIRETTERDIIKKWQSLGGVDIKKQFGRSTVTGGYKHRHIYYFPSSRRVDNFDSDFIYVENWLNFSNQNYILVAYDRAMDRYIKRDGYDRDFSRVWGGARVDISPKVRVDSRCGYAFEDKEGFIHRTRLRYKPTKSITFDAKASRDIGTSITAEDTIDTIIIDRYALSYSYSPPPMPKLTLSGGVSYGISDYDSGGEDDTYIIDAGIEHKLKEWLMLSGKYKRIKKDSDRGDYGFVNNIFSLSLKMEF